MEQLTPTFKDEYCRNAYARCEIHVPQGAMLIFGPWFIHAGFCGAQGNQHAPLFAKGWYTSPRCFGYWDMTAPILQGSTATRLTKQFGEPVAILLPRPLYNRCFAGSDPYMDEYYTRDRFKAAF